MKDWNVVVIVAQDHFKAACRLLEPLGPVKRTHFYNTLVMRVEDVRAFLETLREWMATYPDTTEALARVAPVTSRFEFASAEEFEQQAQKILSSYVPQLAGKRFHVRLHRRDRKSTIARSAEERLLGEMLFEALADSAQSGQVDFSDPDAVVDVETVDQQAGMAIWTREELKRYPFLNPD
ncbi:MAG TPA: THUMP domain-containing protein [Pirellulales bacterium]|nr:THUMP domain-containing protein [Pirellulales bacterium]